MFEALLKIKVESKAMEQAATLMFDSSNQINAYGFGLHSCGS